MTTMTPTKARGATAKPAGVLYVEPGCAVTDEALAADVGLGGAVNAPFVADLLSSMLTHERCGTHLYRSCEARSANPVLQARYRAFGAETQRHVEILETLITKIGGNPNYVSPMARAVQTSDTSMVESTFLGAGSVDPMTAEMAMLDAVFLAESIDHANWSSLARLVEQLPEGDLQSAFRAAVGEVEREEDDHLQWAEQTRHRLVMLQATSSVMADVVEKAQEVTARIRNWFAEDEA